MTESSSVAFKRRPSAETTLDVFGVEVTFLVESEHTGGRFAVLEYVSKPGHEPPPHRHEHEDEVFYIIEGQIEAHCGDQVLQVEAGECLFLPKRKPHGFIIRSPLRRMAEVEEVADLLLFLESAHLVNGEVVHLDGGPHAGKW
jgi:mannose-6-phosphate isomerase-like protein (cupin superfamily)